MINYLSTIVESCTIINGGTDMNLIEKGTRNSKIKFSLPLKFQLRKGDRLEFYQGSISVLEIGNFIDYTSLSIYRGKEKEPFLTISQRDMKILELVREEAREACRSNY